MSSRRSKRKLPKRVQRDFRTYHPHKRVLKPSPLPTYFPKYPDRNLFEVQDNRQRQENYPKTIYGTAAEITDQPVRKRKTRDTLHPGRIAFVDPKKVIVCKRRSERRRELFRRNKIGKGKGVSKKRIITELSKVRC